MVLLCDRGDGGSAARRGGALGVAGGEGSGRGVSPRFMHDYMSESFRYDVGNGRTPFLVVKAIPRKAHARFCMESNLAQDLRVDSVEVGVKYPTPEL